MRSCSGSLQETLAGQSLRQSRCLGPSLIRTFELECPAGLPNRATTGPMSKSMLVRRRQIFRIQSSLGRRSESLKHLDHQIRLSFAHLANYPISLAAGLVCQV